MGVRDFRLAEFGVDLRRISTLQIASANMADAFSVYAFAQSA
jgi:hypothetical protein